MAHGTYPFPPAPGTVCNHAVTHVYSVPASPLQIISFMKAIFLSFSFAAIFLVAKHYPARALRVNICRISGQVGALALGTDPHRLHSLQIGLLTTMAILLHEIPHEVSARGSALWVWSLGEGFWMGLAHQWQA